ncbi:hypothetical protein ACIQLG_16335 [Terribacillus saccharophilus]|uniref:hypothetical protein n=1 Tax=Terribacillus saccharophilus TaxID=361277 RepID=UPI003825BCF0
MVVYETESLKQEIQELISFCSDYNIDCYFDGESFEDLLDEDESEMEPKKITYDTPMTIILPKSEYESEQYTLSEILIMVDRAKTSKITDNYKLIENDFALIRIVKDHIQSSVILFSDVNTEISIGDTRYTVRVIDGLTSFNFRQTVEDMYSCWRPSAN